MAVMGVNIKLHAYAGLLSCWPTARPGRRAVAPSLDLFLG